MVDNETKFPCLLPKKHHLTTLIVYHIHKIHLHAGVNATVTSLREKYWIPSARQVVRSLLQKCICGIHKGKLDTPLSIWLRNIGSTGSDVLPFV